MKTHNNNNTVPLICLITYLCVAVRSAIQPIDFVVRVTEILTSFLPVLILIILYYKGMRFSNTAYILMSVLPILHAIGAHYTFAQVPTLRLSELLGTSRNMFDRMAHISVGFYSYGIVELIDNQKYTNSKGLKLSYALFAIMSLATTYEIFERRYAISSDPSAGLAVLGSQGDIWDAQKDMLMDTIGGIIGIALYQFKPNVTNTP